MLHPIVEIARRVLADYRDARDGRDAATVSVPVSALYDLQRHLAHKRPAGVRQVVTLSTQSAECDLVDHSAWDAAAAQGSSIERIYLVPHSGFADEYLSARLTSDAKRNIRSHRLSLTRFPFESRALNFDGLWLLDGACVFSRATRAGARHYPEWTVSSRAVDVDAAEATWAAIRQAKEAQEEFGLGEPLVLTADLMHGVSAIMCRGDHVDETGCSWYHGAWQYLRLLDLVSTPTWHHSFYTSELDAALLLSAEPRVLITGTADYSVLAYVWAAMRRCHTPINVSVLDRCPSPLFACKWFAKANGFEIETLPYDVLEYARDHAGEYDIVCTDAFLTRFSAPDAKKIAVAWRTVLRDGGALITTVRAHDRMSPVRDDEAAIAAFVERAKNRAQKWARFIDATPDQVAVMAETYARQMKSNRVGDDATIVATIEDSGFDVVSRALASVPGELYPTVYTRLHCRAV